MEAGKAAQETTRVESAGCWTGEKAGARVAPLVAPVAYSYAPASIADPCDLEIPRMSVLGALTDVPISMAELSESGYRLNEAGEWLSVIKA